MGVDYVAIAIVPKNNYDIEKWKQAEKFPSPDTEEGQEYWDNTMLVSFASFRRLNVVGSTIYPEHRAKPPEYFKWDGSSLIFDLLFKKYPVCKIFIISDHDEEPIDWVDYLFPESEADLFTIAVNKKNKYPGILINIEDEIENEINNYPDAEESSSDDEEENTSYLRDSRNSHTYNKFIINESKNLFINLHMYIKLCNRLIRETDYCIDYAHPLSRMCRYSEGQNDEQDDDDWCGDIIYTTNDYPDMNTYNEMELDENDFEN